MKFFQVKLIIGLIFFLSGTTPLFSFQMGKQPKVRAPELTGGIGWLNTDKPLTLAGLKGKVVLLDFWTYGCINCIHIIPDLHKLEAKYGNQLIVIGVHSAKFENEKDTENIRRIILRYGVEHPVINDANFTIWDAYAIRGWPGLVVIDPAGYVLGTWFGEGQFGEIDDLIGKTADEFRKKGTLDEQPLKFALERAKVGNLPLAFPGKVLADEKSNRLFIADSNHNRVVVTDLDGKLIETIGNGSAALKNGAFGVASFNKPQGMALDGDNLYVADTENHSIRRINLKTKTVETIAGTGELYGFTGFGGDALKTSLRSPWDLSLVGRNLYVAMAGSHQIWRLYLDKKQILPYAGSRVEARLDGRIEAAGFAQPSGIVSDGKRLFVADSESNIIREINFESETVETLVGGDLFSFGDKDGEGDDVRLQHPLGVEFYDGKIYLADTYNHKIKILDPEKRTVTSFLGTGKSGQTDGSKPTFYEPGGISVAGGKLYVADTNNHAVRVVDLKSKLTKTLKIDGLSSPIEMVEDTAAASRKPKEIKIEQREISSDSQNSLVVNISLPQGFHLNPNAPQRYEIVIDGSDSIKFENPRQKFKSLPLNIPFQAGKVGSATIKPSVTIYYCREDNTGVCYIKSLSWNVPVKIISGKVGGKLEISAKVE